MNPIPRRAAIYARVSTLDQEPENQLAELRRYVRARSWDAAVEYVDHGVSGAKDRRPALDRLIRDARRRRIDVPSSVCRESMTLSWRPPQPGQRMPPRYRCARSGPMPADPAMGSSGYGTGTVNAWPTVTMAPPLASARRST